MGIRKLFYLGIEPYVGRYSWQLEEWAKRSMIRQNVDYQIIHGDRLELSGKIVTGQVLDAHGRSYYSLTQMAKLVQLMKTGEITNQDVIFFEDMFTPGIEALPYIMYQVDPSYRPRVFVRCLAQSIDPDDFIHVWGMEKFMSHYEHMVNDFATILATSEEMVANMKIAGWKGPIYNISGLTFNADEVRSRVNPIKNWEDRKRRVVFASRWDMEKQPQFFLDMAERFWQDDPTVEFAILQGGPLRSNDERLVALARIAAMDRPNFKIYENLNKNSYYELLQDSRVLFNCALQDWVSNTVNEADALGTNVVYPAYRSFPETFDNDETRMYIPWSAKDADQKVKLALNAPSPLIGNISKWNDLTMDRCIGIMQGSFVENVWNRSGRNYRNYLNNGK